MNQIPCSHFMILPQTHCGIGGTDRHGSGLRAPRDCGMCCHYDPAFMEYLDARELGDEQYLTAWANALKGKEA